MYFGVEVDATLFFGLVAKSSVLTNTLGVFVKTVPQLVGDCWLNEKEGVPRHSSDKSIKKSLSHDSFKKHLKSIS